MFKTKIIKNWLPKDLHEYLVNYFSYGVPHHFGHGSVQHPELSDKYQFYNHYFMGNPLVDYLKFKILNEFDSKIEILRSYINVQHQNMESIFHKDDGNVTILYMVCGEGNFQIINDYEVTGENKFSMGKINPKDMEDIEFENNKLIIFDAQRPHRGNPPKKGMRITLAFKTNWITNE